MTFVRHTADCAPDRCGAAVSADRLQALAEQFWVFQCEEYPLTGIGAGAATGDIVLREAPHDHERRAETARRLQGELDGIAADSLASDDRVTHALLARELGLLVRLVDTGAHLRPSLFPFGADMMVLLLGSIASIADRADAERYIGRLAVVPAVLDGTIATLRAGLSAGHRYPSLIVAHAVAQARALAAMAAEQSPLLDPFTRGAAPARALADFETAARHTIANIVLPAFARYADMLEHELGPEARTSLAYTDAPGGDEHYRLAIAQHATVDDVAETIHALGLAEVARLSAELEAVAVDAGFPGDIAGLRRRARSPDQFASSADALRERMAALSKSIDARIPEIVGRLPRATYGVRTIPEAMAGRLPPAYAQPGPADGTAAGTFWVTPDPAKLPAYLHPAIALHEAWPGHLMHIALIQEREDLPAFRRHGATRYAAYLEGWALYCEWLGEELGLIATPLARFGRLDLEMWRACRLVVDTGIHALGWSREQAVGYMRAHLALPVAVIGTDVDRYVGWPGQALAYQLGNRAFRDLRREAEAALGERFQRRGFHDALIAAGPVTLPILTDVMRAWIEERA